VLHSALFVGWTMALVRSIGRWTMTAVVINSLIGSGVFALPGVLNRLLGRASPFAMIFAAGAMAIIMACVAEVASQFSEAGGAYLYTRTAFGRFVGMQIAWFFLLAVVGAVAVAANVFVDYLAPFLPWTLNAWERPLVLAFLMAIPTAANCCGVRTGANLSNVMTVAKLSPLALLILFGIVRFAHQPQVIHASEIVTPGWSNWARALTLLMGFAYAGWEESLIPTGEVREPRRTIPFAMVIGLIAAATVYTLLQFITVATVGSNATEQSLAQTASVLLGRSGATLVSIAIMLATYGYMSANLLNDSRLAYSLAAQGDFPRIFARIHPRFHTPTVAITIYALTGWALAVSGTFQFVLALAAGATVIYYAAMCACLIRLRSLRPSADAFRIPFGPALSIIAVVISLTLMTGLTRRELLLMCVTALIAAANWLWGRRYHPELQIKAKAALTLLSPQ
jgi:basic amino acid/polyamine antiporter, APA family